MFVFLLSNICWCHFLLSGVKAKRKTKNEQREKKIWKVRLIRLNHEVRRFSIKNIFALRYVLCGWSAFCLVCDDAGLLSRRVYDVLWFFFLLQRNRQTIEIICDTYLCVCAWSWVSKNARRYKMHLLSGFMLLQQNFFNYTFACEKLVSNCISPYSCGDTHFHSICHFPYLRNLIENLNQPLQLSSYHQNVSSKVNRDWNSKP